MVCHAAEPLPAGITNNTIDRLTKRQAGVTARKMATRDFQAGRFVLLDYSKGPWTNACKEYLKAHYNVAIDFTNINQTDPMLNAIEVYNSTMSALLKKKFGKDIFKEAKEQTRQ